MSALRRHQMVSGYRSQCALVFCLLGNTNVDTQGRRFGRIAIYTIVAYPGHEFITMTTERDERQNLHVLRKLADRALARAADAPLVKHNHVRVLKDAGENYPAWLEAINAAKHHVHLENYIIYEDDIGRAFADALIAKRREAVPVRLIYDWMGGLGKTSRRFWDRLRASGVEVRCYNPPRFDTPFGWLSRDHRKMLAVDGRVAFISGLCLGRRWVGDPQRNVPPWRDTGVEVRGPAVADIERAFVQTWNLTGDPIGEPEMNAADPPAPAGDMNVCIVASLPATADMLRVDELVAALAQRTLWLTDAYFAGTTSYVRALRAASKDGVDVRLLLPNATDIPVLRPLSRAGYRPLLEAGVRVFEWNGPMIHAKTAVVDGHWARVGSTNLNIASWFGNCELDAIVEDDSFGHEMEEMYLQDLTNATEIVLDIRRRLLASGEAQRPRPTLSGGGGSAGRAAAGAIRVGNAIGAAFTNRRALGPVEARLMLTAGLSLLALAILFGFMPFLLSYPLTAIIAWTAVALLYRAYRLNGEGKPAPGGHAGT